jgi:hypothetical protein
MEYLRRQGARANLLIFFQAAHFFVLVLGFSKFLRTKDENEEENGLK